MKDRISFGVDLSKNHFGLCTIKPNGKIEFVYFFFKPFFVKDYKNHPDDQAFIENLNKIKKENFTFLKYCCKYNNKNFSQIRCDSLKSSIAVEFLFRKIRKFKSDMIVILEDYVYGGTKIVQLVHVSESFKYLMVDDNIDHKMTLALISVGTWRKYMWADVKGIKGEETYDRIIRAMKIFHKDAINFIESLNESKDVVKELIDSYALAIMKNHWTKPFEKNYQKNIYHVK